MKSVNNFRRSSLNKDTIRVLILDSGQYKNETIQETLESRGFQVRLVKLNGKDPEPGVYRDTDIIIFDAGNLTTDGYRRCTTIRQSSPSPLLVLSTLSQPNVIANMLDCGADDFITKPVSFEILIAHIHKLTRRARSFKKA